MSKKFATDIAKSICADLGIEWDENASEFTLDGKPVTSEAIRNAFDSSAGPTPVNRTAELQNEKG